MSGIDDLIEDPVIAEVTVDGLTKHVRTLSGLEMYEVMERAEGKGTGLVAQVLLQSICDEKGRPLVSDEKELRRIPKRWIDALFEKAAELNDIGATEKNSEADQGSSSS